MKTRRSVVSPALLVPIGLVLLAVGYFGYQWYASGQQVTEARARLLEHIAIELEKDVVDASELSRLVVRIKEFEDHDSAPDLLAAQARIELVRGRPERAYELFVPVAGRPGASPEVMALASEILLRHHESGVTNRGDAVLMLEQALAMADQAHAYRNEVDDLLRAWLACMRLSDKERTEEFAAKIEAEYPESSAHRLVRICRAFPQVDRNDLELVRSEFDDPPLEIEAMLALLILGDGDVAGAVSQAEGTLARGAGVVEVRWTAAVVFHACVEGSEQGSPERARWAVRRNAQLDWLLEQGAGADPRRPNWIEWRNRQ